MNRSDADTRAVMTESRAGEALAISEAAKAQAKIAVVLGAIAIVVSFIALWRAI